jgi:glycosyltransferase involved in cell wall biosynthesis
VKPVRVLHVVTRFILGGAQEATLLSAALVDQARFPSEILTGTESGPEGNLFAEAKALGVRLHFEPTLVRELHPVKDVLAVARMTSFFRRYQPDVVHTHSSKAGILGRIAARLAGVPVVVHTAHGWPFRRTQPWPIRFACENVERLGAALSDRIPVVSQPTYDAAISWRIGPPGKFVLIRDPIEVERFRADSEARARVRLEFGFEPHHFLFGFLSRLSTPKRPDTVVRAFARVHAKHPDARLLIVGEGALREGTERAIRELGLSDLVRLAGLRRDVPALMSAFDAFVLVTAWEGLPCVLPQALSARLPIITSAVGGTPDAVEDGVTGYLIPPGDFETLVERMDCLASDPAAARAMGAAGDALLAQFSAPAVARQLEAMYEELARSARGEPPARR